MSNSVNINFKKRFMIKLKNILNEYITNPILDLKKYLTKSEEDRNSEIGEQLAYIDLTYLKDYLRDNHPDILRKYITYFKEDDADGIISIFKKDYPNIFKDYAQYIMTYKFQHRSHLSDFFYDGYPSWEYFDYMDIVKNQWLIHFSDNAFHIHDDGKFDNLVTDFTKLGLTTHYVDKYDRDDYGYGFAYLLSDFERHYRNRGRNKYGDEAVLFRASGIRVWHYGDQEPQVIFYGPTAHDIVYIQENYGDYSVKGVGKRDLLYTGDISDVVSWIVNNYDQYKKNI